MKLFTSAVFKSLTVLLFLFLSHSASAQFKISGKILDGKTGEELPAANIHIEGTYRGTISNGEGGWELVLYKLPANIIVRYVGYETFTLAVPDTAQRRFMIRLTPVELALPEIVVTGDDPAKDIMRKVIANKKIWREKLMTFQAEAYTRQSLQTDTLIASITESFSTAYWDRKQGPREVIKAKRQTRNITASENFAAASYIPNFYDDDIEIANFKMVGPTHPDALDFYTFKLTDYQYIDNKLIFILDMKPRRKLQPTFIGTIRVLAEQYALIDVDVKPGESVQFPPPIQEWNVAYRQQFNNFGGEFWLPVDVRLNGMIKIGLPGLQFPPIRYNQTSTLSDYEVNIILPDSLYKTKRMLRVDSVSVAKNTMFETMREPVPMSLSEQKAYETLDSTQTFEKMFKPKGMLARFVNDEEENDSRSKRRRKDKKDAKPPSKFEKFMDDFSPDLWYNRVEGAHPAVNWEPRFKNKKIKIRPSFSAGYAFNLDRWAWDATAEYSRRIGKKRFLFEGGFSDGAETRYESTNYSKYSNSFSTLVAFNDYFDYYWNTRQFLSANMRIPRKDIEFTLKVSNERHRSLSAVTDWNIFGISDSLWPNPAIQEGWMRPVALTFNWGDDLVPLGIVGQNSMNIKLEHASGITGSDYNFTQVRFRSDFRIETFYKRRFSPNVLDVRVEASTHAGTLPTQRYAALDGAITVLSPFGSFRSMAGNPIAGRHTAAVFWEHNFRTIPTEFLGLKTLAKKGYGLILFGNHGVVSGLDTRYLHIQNTLPSRVTRHEIGVGVNGIFSFMRADFTYRIDQPGYFVTLTAARIF